VLDRPNPVGRPIEGMKLKAGGESFVGAGEMPMRHGLTMGELAHWFVRTLRLDVDCQVIPMDAWEPSSPSGYGWPAGRRTWVNPSPNAPNLWMTRCYPGSVMLEGTTLSEGRGTTRPLEVLGAPDIDVTQLLNEMHTIAPTWMRGCRVRPCWFEPTFHKHVGKLCAGFQVHVEDGAYYDHEAFRPWRLFALAFKALRRLRPEYPLWRDFPYEYEKDRLAIDVINGSDLLRRWVDEDSSPADLDALSAPDERAWEQERRAVLLY
jgi:uncharacterized protein YbbC (DUF1343 family)